MFIFITDPVSGQNNISVFAKSEKAKDPDRLFNLLFGNSTQAASNVNNNIPDINPETMRMKNALTRAMERATGQLLTRDMDPPTETLMSYLEQLTGVIKDPEGKKEKAFNQFFESIRNEKPDVYSNPEKFFEAIITTWINSSFEGLPNIPMPTSQAGLRGHQNDNSDIEDLKQKGIEVLDGGVDPIAGAKIKLKINGVEYEGFYGGVGGVNADSLRSADGSPPSADIIKLVNDNNELITRVAAKKSYGH